MKNKEEIENEFEWWITSIPDKTERLEELLPSEVWNKLDHSISSLEELGNYICKTIPTIDDLKREHELWDCYASYVGSSYRRLVPTAFWRVELDNVDDVFFGIPALRTSRNTNFYPKFEISTMIDRKRPDFLSAITKRHIELQE